MLAFITKSSLGHPKSKNYRNFSPAAGIYWLIKLSILSLSHEIQLLKIHKKLPSMLTFITKLFLGHSTNKNHRNFSPAAGMCWLIKLPALPLNHSFKKLPQTLSFTAKLLTAQSVYNFSQIFAHGESAKKFFWATVHETRSFVSMTFTKKTIRLI